MSRLSATNKSCSQQLSSVHSSYRTHKHLISMNDRQINVCYKLHRSQEDESRIVSFVKSYLQNLKVETGWNTYSFSIENLMVNYLQNQAEISCQNCIWLLYTDIFYPWSPQVRLSSRRLTSKTVY